MRRFGLLLTTVMLVLPAAASAQRPGNNMQIRSAELYLDRAEKTQVPEEKNKLFQQAHEMAMQAVAKDPGNSKTWYTLGRIYALQGNALGADSAFDKAETMWPDYVKETDIERQRAYVTAFNEGVAAIQKNDLGAAIRNLEAAHVVFPKKPTASLNLGNLYAKANDAEKAAASYRTALSVLRGEYRKGLSEAEEKQWAQWEEAASFNLAQILATSQKDAEAAEAYTEYLQRNPTNNIARANLAVVYGRMGKKDEATKVYNELLAPACRRTSSRPTDASRCRSRS
jgi:tetratricopeptide (TPR) repeat protein